MLNATPWSTRIPRSTRATLTMLFSNAPAAMIGVVARPIWPATSDARNRLAPRAPPEQEIRDIGARDEEYDRGDAEQHDQGRLCVPEQRALPLLSWCEDGPLYAELGHHLVAEALLERRLDVGDDGMVQRVKPGAGLRQRHARL